MQLDPPYKLLLMRIIESNIVYIFGSSAKSVGTNPLKTEFASANDGIFERKHQG